MYARSLRLYTVQTAFWFFQIMGNYFNFCHSLIFCPLFPIPPEIYAAFGRRRTKWYTFAFTVGCTAPPSLSTACSFILNLILPTRQFPVCLFVKCCILSMIRVIDVGSMYILPLSGTALRVRPSAIVQFPLDIYFRWKKIIKIKSEKSENFVTSGTWLLTLISNLYAIFNISATPTMSSSTTDYYSSLPLNVSPHVTTSSPLSDQPTIGLIGMGDMGRMYANRLSDAGWRKCVGLFCKKKKSTTKKRGLNFWAMAFQNPCLWSSREIPGLKEGLCW